MRLLYSSAQAKLDAIDQSQAMIEFTPEGVIIDANANFLKALGYSLDEIRGKKHSLFVIRRSTTRKPTANSGRLSAEANFRPRSFVASARAGSSW